MSCLFLPDMLQAKVSDAVEGAADRVQNATSSETIQQGAEKVKQAATAGDPPPMKGKTVVITGDCWARVRTGWPVTAATVGCVDQYKEPSNG